MEHPQPDDKNWTWVLERPCPECGFDASAIARRAVGAMLRDNIAAWRAALNRGELTRQRPPKDPDGGVIWSALEYGCHVRDVFVLFNERLQLMLTHDDPTFLNWDQDATAIEKRYWEDDPATVLAALQEAGSRLADAFDQVRDDQWTWTGERSDGSRFSIESFGVYMLHDPVHHLWDVAQGFEALA